MSKEEDLAYKAYPYNGDYRGQGDSNSKFREAYVNGYHQAEKDIALTIDDIEKIDNLLWNLSSEWSGKNDNVGYFQEVLNQFNKYKEE